MEIDFPQKDIRELIGRLNTLADSIDHRYNLESLILFVSRDIAGITRY